MPRPGLVETLTGLDDRTSPRTYSAGTHMTATSLPPDLSVIGLVDSKTTLPKA
jgi:hypothetical protein